ncbi:MAG: AI-2E family transporter [Candidatus Binataceae bacterium]
MNQEFKERLAAEPELESQTRLDSAIGIVVLTLLFAGCVFVLWPFGSAVLWAVILCFSTWTLFERLKILLGGMKSLAALLMTLMLAVVAISPFLIVGASLADNVAALAAAVRKAIENGPYNPPAWVSDLPLVGSHLHDYLERLAHDPAARVELFHQLIHPARIVALKGGAILGHGILEIAISLLIVFFLYRDGNSLSSGVEAMAVRIAGRRGRRLLDVASLTMMGVVYGVIGTALIQGIVAALGFWIAGVPGGFLLGFATFILSFIPAGPALIWIPASVWLYAQGAPGWAVFLILWGVIAVGGVEYAVKPLFIARTGSTPVILLMLGVFGGALAFGFIGVFIGPTLLAVGYSLLQEWNAEALVIEEAPEQLATPIPGRETIS